MSNPPESDWSEYQEWYNQINEDLLTDQQEKVFQNFLEKMDDLVGNLDPPLTILKGSGNLELNWIPEENSELDATIHPNGEIEIVYFSSDIEKEVVETDDFFDIEDLMKES